MIERILKPGGDAAWLPSWEEGAAGNGKECSNGCLDMNVKGTKAKYLPFLKNGINYVESNGVDVISYNFTGCIMAAYTPRGGSRRVCHVSTGEGQDCKDEWDKVKGQAGNVTEFKPSDSIDPAKLKGSAFKGCYGIITADDKCFAVVVAEKKGKLAIVHQAQVT